MNSNNNNNNNNNSDDEDQECDLLHFFRNSQAIATLVEDTHDDQQATVDLLCGANRYDEMEWSFGTEDILDELWGEFDEVMEPESHVDLRARTDEHVKDREPTKRDLMVTLLGIAKEYIFDAADMIVTLRGRLVPVSQYRAMAGVMNRLGSEGRSNVMSLVTWRRFLRWHAQNGCNLVRTPLTRSQQAKT